MTWLIAEDEADIRNLIALMCQVWGHTPLTFENGQRVWEWLDTVEQGQPNPIPELILMDIRMPGKKGNELANRMRTIEPLRRTPIVLMTAFSLSEQERGEMISGDGVDRILSKPLPDFEQLRGILDEIVQQKRESVVQAQQSPSAPAAATPKDEQPSTAQNDSAQEAKPTVEQADTTEARGNEPALDQQSPTEVTESPTNPPTQEPPAKEANQT